MPDALAAPGARAAINTLPAAIACVGAAWLVHRCAKSRARAQRNTGDDEADDVSPEQGTADIEELLLKSLIPVTLKWMKQSGVKPYTLAQRREKLDELNTLDFTRFAANPSVQKDLKRRQTKVFQINVGLNCNQACTHCHVDSSPLRKEMMSRATADQCLKVIANSPSIECVDLTGGAPELNREFRHLVRSVRELGLEVINRCNLTVLLEPKQKDLGQFLADQQVHIIASLPCYLEDNVDEQRGDQVFMRSIKGLRQLNDLGYGKGGALKLDLVYNPTGVHLPPSAEKLEGAYKTQLAEKFGIVFDNLHTITNMPINRFYDYLKVEEKLQKYMELLVSSFNPHTVDGLMCKDLVSLRWDGRIYDCDFNQQVELDPKSKGTKKGVSIFDIGCTDDILPIGIATGLHCYGCTAGAGSG